MKIMLTEYELYQNAMMVVANIFDQEVIPQHSDAFDEALNETCTEITKLPGYDNSVDDEAPDIERIKPFIVQVARDILNGTVHPEFGNVREAVEEIADELFLASPI